MTRHAGAGEKLGPVDVRLRISGLWIATLFIFAYVDLFTLYRRDVRAELVDERLAVFDINQAFLFGVTLYVVIPSLMVYLTLVMGRHLSRIVNITVAAVYGMTITGSAEASGTTSSWAASWRRCSSLSSYTARGPGPGTTRCSSSLARRLMR
jgi:Family of unknown function (DUF6326)